MPDTQKQFIIRAEQPQVSKNTKRGRGENEREGEKKSKD